MDRIWLRTPSGVDLMYSLPLDEYIDRQWRDGTLTRVTEDGEIFDGDPFEEPSEGGLIDAETVEATGESEHEPTAQPAAAGDVSEPVRPAPNAPKPEWAAYAAALGLDPAGKTKAQIVDMVTPQEMKPEV